MRTFLGALLAIVVVVAVLAAFGWIFFFREGDQLGVGVNSDEAVQESRVLVETVSESVGQVSGEIKDVSGTNREESVPVVVEEGVPVVAEESDPVVVPVVVDENS